MSFFNINQSNGKSSLVVDSHWWIYPAVTIPLTLIVCGVWLCWLKWKGYMRGVVRKRARVDHDERDGGENGGEEGMLTRGRQNEPTVVTTVIPK